MKFINAIVESAIFLAPWALLSHAQSPSSAPSEAVSWLVPDDAKLTKAIDVGFYEKKMAKDERYHKYLTWIKPEVDSQIEVVPPLFCAEQVGQTAHDKLESKPDLEKVKRLCLNWVTVTIVHYSQSLRANWPCVFQKGDFTLQPLMKRLDENPQVTKYYGGFFAGDVVGYRYVDIYAFQFPPTLIAGATLVYADESGEHHTLNYDFAAFARDIARPGEPTHPQSPPAPGTTKHTITGGPEGAGHSPETAENLATTPKAAVVDESADETVMANSVAGKSSPAAAAGMASAGHVLTPDEMAAQVQAGQASKCAVITVPPGAEIFVDGNKAGVSPMVFVLLRKGDTARVITIKMSGYETVEKRVVPDGKIFPLGLALEKEGQKRRDPVSMKTQSF